MDMDMDPYCAAPKVLEAHRWGLNLCRGTPKECLVDGVHTLWEEDTRREKK
ncbi:MAG TPA: hypothetical protein VE261_01380 [Gaiellaceae bacterium]|jgi:hypothetical protein|nr:hypothetical protein [Gaiellaceae bacterium]